MATLLELYERLKPKLGEQEARELLEFIEQSVERRAATKEDLRRAEAALREEIHQEIAALREELHREIASVRADLQRVRADLLKWTFAFWVGNVAVLSGILFALFQAFLGR